VYAIVKTGGKQYRVERGQTLLVERLPLGEGDTCSLEPLLYVDGDQVIDGGQSGPEVRVQARVLAHERGPKLRVVKFKPKRGYKRRTGHRQELTRIEITAIQAGEGQRRSRARKRSSGTAGASPKEATSAPGAGTSPKEESDGT
jgi:large subunit ribosomal protein L21